MSSNPSAQPKAPAQLSLEVNGRSIACEMSGAWQMGESLPEAGGLIDLLEGDLEIDRVVITARDLHWDPTILPFLMQLNDYAGQRNLRLEVGELPDNLGRLLKLATSVPEDKTARKNNADQTLATRLGQGVLDFMAGTREATAFVGETILSLIRMMTGRVKWRRKEVWVQIQECGVEALPIVALLSFLIGLIIAFLGAVVLRKFAAEYYVSYLVGYGMLREMGPVITAVIMAGRTGAAFAARLGSMKVSEEIDALQTLGLSPFDFLVLPRLLALALMMPILTCYADALGILGGFGVATSMLDIPYPNFMRGLTTAVDWSDFMLGLCKSFVFGILVAIAGCLRGMQSGLSADAVGKAATSAVVTGITLIVISNALIDWLAAIFNI